MTRVLGSRVDAPVRYAPSILEPIGRRIARNALGLADDMPFVGVDVWHLYELSWLEQDRGLQSYVGVLCVPFDSPAIVESKSLKLYLNSLNFHLFSDQAEAIDTIKRDLAGVLGCAVSLELFYPEALSTITHEPQGEPLLTPQPQEAASRDACLTALETRATVSFDLEQCYVSHHLRSLCPVTGQPDWASVVIEFGGKRIDPALLSDYLLTFREHQEFHEQCVERIFLDLKRALSPDSLCVAAYYQRRGGIDITPWRASENRDFPLHRMARQ